MTTVVKSKRRHHGEIMKAVVWQGHVNQVAVKEVPRPTIQEATDIIVKVTTAGICGSDLHVYHGLIGSPDPHWNVGHEAVGIIVEVGSHVTKLKIGQRVVVPDVIANFPTSSNGLAWFGLGHILGSEALGGCQAEYVRLPLAEDNAFVVPDGLDDNDFITLSDIWPTAWDALAKSAFQAGDSVAVFGCGPVGLLGQYSALLRGASTVYAIDHVDSRLAKAKSIGAIPIDLKKGAPADQILKLEPNGVRRSLDLCGFECVNDKLQPDEGYILQQAVKVTGFGGGIAVTGVYTGVKPSPGSPEQSLRLSIIPFDIGDFWAKELSMSGGPVIPHTIVPQLIPLIVSGRAKPGFIVDSVIDINDAPKGYRDFSNHKHGKTLIRFSP